MADNVIRQSIKPVPVPEPETGIDTSGALIDSIISAAQVGGLDISSIDALSQSAQGREQIYELIDSMATDDIISSVLDVYVDDTIQTNDKGQVIWAESSDSKVLDYVSWLIESLNLDKYLADWTHCLVTYGDFYVRLYRRSDYDDDILFKNNKKNRLLNEAQEKIENDRLREKHPELNKNAINEDVALKLYSVNDPYIPYVEMVPNPAEVFDLQKFGKTYGYIKAPVRVVQETSDELYNYLTRYKMKKQDVEIYDAMSFVHGYLESTTQRQPETVDIYLDGYADDLKNKDFKSNSDEKELDFSSDNYTSYNVKRGQSILYNSFRIWRELNLLEMSALLNRLTRSSLVRILNIQVPDMPKDQVANYISRLKEKIEQKSALEAGKGMQEYTNPGPIMNTIYIPTYGDKGSITAQTLGGDFDPKSLVDLEYFRDKLFGNLKVPKQFFGFTEDGAGFNGGTSLTILSSRYGKTIKKIQNVLCQTVTDIINLFLIDRGLDNYVNKFRIRMQAPITQEEIDRRQNTDNRTRYIGDIMNQISGLVDDKATQLKIYKSLLTEVVNDSEIVALIQGYIDKLESAQKEEQKPADETGGDNADFSTSGGSDMGGGSDANFDLGDISSEPAPAEEPVMPEPAESTDLPSPAEVLPNESFIHDENKDLLMEDDGNADSYLPSPDELGI